MPHPTSKGEPINNPYKTKLYKKQTPKPINNSLTKLETHMSKKIYEHVNKTNIGQTKQYIKEQKTTKYVSQNINTHLLLP